MYEFALPSIDATGFGTVWGSQPAGVLYTKVLVRMSCASHLHQSASISPLVRD